MQDTWFLFVAAVVLTGVFAVLIVVGLRMRGTSEARSLRDTTVDEVWELFSGSAWSRSDLLFGIWQTTMTDVNMVVKDQTGSQVGTITTNLSAGTTIDVGAESYQSVPRATWLVESAELVRTNASAPEPICVFERKGWSGRTAQYTIPTLGVLTIRAPLRFLSRWDAVPVLHEGREIGQIAPIGDASNYKGWALVLPKAIPMPVRLFILRKVVGSRP